MLVPKNAPKKFARVNKKLFWSVRAKNAASNFKFAKEGEALENTVPLNAWPPCAEKICEKQITPNGIMDPAKDLTQAEKPFLKSLQSADIAKTAETQKICKDTIRNRIVSPLLCEQIRQISKCCVLSVMHPSTQKLPNLFLLAIFILSFVPSSCYQLSLDMVYQQLWPQL